MSTRLDAVPESAGYMLLFRNTQWYHGDHSAEELQDIVDGVMSWFASLDKKGIVLGANPLFERSVVVTGEGGRSVTDGPFAEAKEAIGGYVLLKVDSMEEAVAIARTNPMLKYGLTTEVREVASSCPSLYRARQTLAAAVA
jgi:hypothetical protein